MRSSGSWRARRLIQATMFNAAKDARGAYAIWVSETERGDRCLACGECESKCPQGIEIIEWLEKADHYLASQKP
jgi:uncharacterized protein